jgi:hypothetical protein
MRAISALEKILLLGCVLCVSPLPLAASAPEWLHAAANMSLPKYPEDTKAVVLFSEQITTVVNSGEIRTIYREADRILRPRNAEGRDYGVVQVGFDKDTRLTSFKAWCIPAEGKDYEVKEKDALEINLSRDSLYDEDRLKLLKIPAAVPGNVVGYEYEQRRRPTVLQDIWDFQDRAPVVRSRYTLQLPPGWEFGSFWRNHPEQKPQQAGENAWTWEVQNLEPIEVEPSMPHWRALTGQLGISFYSPQGAGVNSQRSWRDIGLWYAQLAANRREDSPEIRQKVTDLTSQAKDSMDKMQALARFVQQDVRYVAIEIGIGGFQPHPAADIFTNRYGDCKDKVTLLSTMLKDIGIDSYYVVINASRGAVWPEFPTVNSFNHVILAIKLPPDAPPSRLWAIAEHPGTGPLLYFDPTDEMTHFGDIPADLQGSYGLLVTGAGGELVKLPLLPPSLNRLLRQARLSLTSDGTLAGDVTELRWGWPAALWRARLLGASESDRKKIIENFLGDFLNGFVMQSWSVENLDNRDQNLVINYRFSVRNYAKVAGSLILLKPRVLGEQSRSIFETGKERKNPVEFSGATSQSDLVEITLPPGYQVEEIPPAAKLDMGIVSYNSKTELQGNALHYTRLYQVNDVLVPKARLNELRQFYSQIAADERATAVLKWSAAESAQN